MDELLKQWKKGVMELVVLSLLSRGGEMYGYSMLRLLGERSGGVFLMKEGTLYPVLYRLEDAGRISSRWEDAAGRKAPKKYYSITPQGREYLKEAGFAWREFASGVEIMIR